MAPAITTIEWIDFAYEVEDVGIDDYGFNAVYEPGSTREFESTLLRVHTDVGVTGAGRTGAWRCRRSSGRSWENR